jgi:hypothetical protein
MASPNLPHIFPAYPSISCIAAGDMTASSISSHLKSVRQILTGNRAKFLPDYQTDTDSGIAANNL